MVGGEYVNYVGFAFVATFRVSTVGAAGGRDYSPPSFFRRMTVLFSSRRSTSRIAEYTNVIFTGAVCGVKNTMKGGGMHDHLYASRKVANAGRRSG